MNVSAVAGIMIDRVKDIPIGFERRAIRKTIDKTVQEMTYRDMELVLELASAIRRADYKQKDFLRGIARTVD